MLKKCIRLILQSRIKRYLHYNLSLHYNRANSYLCNNVKEFINSDCKEIRKFKEKDFEIVATPMCLGNISKDWPVDNIKTTGLNGYVYDFSVDYDAIAVGDMLDIHSYLKIT